MGLTQVMLQVKGCEMVCKQRELIPGLRRWSQALNRERVAVSTLVRALKIATDGFSGPVCCLAQKNGKCERTLADCVSKTKPEELDTFADTCSLRMSGQIFQGIQYTKL